MFGLLKTIFKAVPVAKVIDLVSLGANYFINRKKEAKKKLNENWNKFSKKASSRIRPSNKRKL